jgi:DNA-binding NtrC family response regulator
MTQNDGIAASDATETRLLVLGRCRQILETRAGENVNLRSFDSVSELIDQARELRARACIVCPDMLRVAEETESFVDRLRVQAPFLDIVVWAPDAPGRVVRTALLHGVRDVVLETDPETVVRRLREIVDAQQFLPRLLDHDAGYSERWEFEGMISRSQKMRDLFEICVRTAATDATVLILGETGTGKELLARAFHRRSQRAGRLVTINCSAVPENLIDSELFGHVRGAFTGAQQEKEGLFRYADGGTLFLDEVGSIPLQAQYRLLRALQEGRVRPVGSDREVPVDVRVIAATSVRLDEAVDQGTFRHDLLYRLDVIRAVVPPLRQRPEDILLLFGHFMRGLSDHHGVPRPQIDDSFLDAFVSHDWPGNVRQLENLTERLLLTHAAGERLTADHFATLVAPPQTEDAGDALADAAPDLERSLPDEVDDAVRRTERAYLQAALQRTGGKVGRTAEIAGISRRTLLRKLKRLEVDRTAYRRPGTIAGDREVAE